MAAARASSRKPSPLQPRWCNKVGCDTKVILGLRADTNRWVPYEAETRDPSSLAAAGCHVLVGAQAWTPHDLAEHFRVRFEITAEKARDLVRDYPHHRPHFHIEDD
jgi:hypothetical protein